MGFWSGIKHALNSTLGTADFQPLDKIIKSQRTYGPSDDVLVTLASGLSMTITSTLKKVPNVKFVPLVDGTLKVMANVTIVVSGLGESTSIYFQIYKNGESYLSKSIGKTGTASGAQRSTQTLEINCPIEKGATYEFYTYVSGSNSILNNLELGGQIVDLSMLEYTTY